MVRSAEWAMLISGVFCVTSPATYPRVRPVAAVDSRQSCAYGVDAAAVLFPRMEMMRRKVSSDVS